jgi:hypothetical protein
VHIGCPISASTQSPAVELVEESQMKGWWVDLSRFGTGVLGCFIVVESGFVLAAIDGFQFSRASYRFLIDVLLRAELLGLALVCC